MVSAKYLQPADAFIDQEGDLASEPKAPMVASGENLYIVWWTNKSGNWEVMFRASDDFGDHFFLIKFSLLIILEIRHKTRNLIRFESEGLPYLFVKKT